MTVVELTDLKTTINWLLENGDFKDKETSYNISMNSINILKKALSIDSVSQQRELLIDFSDAMYKISGGGILITNELVDKYIKGNL